MLCIRLDTELHLTQKLMTVLLLYRIYLDGEGEGVEHLECFGG